jgi:hypothetical protein
MTHVVAILKLAQILPQMMATDMNVSAVNGPLQLRPEALDSVDASALRGRILSKLVVDLHMAITGFVDIVIAAKFIGIEGRSRHNVRQDKRLHGLFGARFDNAGNQFAIAFQHPDNASLVALVTAPHAGNRATDKRFVDLDGFAKAAKRIVAVLFGHEFADFVAHAPRRFVGHAKLALDFLGGHAIPRSAEKEHDIKPIAQRSAGAMERRIGGRKDLVAAEIAGVRPAFRDRVELGFAPAFFAIMREAVAGHHKMLQTGFFGRETVLKLAKCGGFRFHSHYIARNLPWCKGIIINLFQDNKPPPNIILKQVQDYL